ncbi:MAG: AbgT family transporter [Myxococcales bacterium FL481]|nr:MAG: AbgT family transporter [Myxococcales bacterium FL481]
MSPDQGSRASGVVATALRWIEVAGNRLPHPGTLFAMMAVLTVLMSQVFAALDVAVQHPSTDETIRCVNLLSVDGLHRILTDMVVNFTGFAPLGTVLVAMLGIGIAEHSGLIGAALRLLVLRAPRGLLTFTLVFAGVLSNAASEIGYVLLVPLGAVIFRAVGRHPIAGLAATFAGVSGGYSANLVIGTVDPLLAGLSTEAAHIIDSEYEVNSLANYYFMLASTFLIAGAGTWTTEKLVVPRLGVYNGGDDAEAASSLQELSSLEKRGLVYAGVTLLVSFALIGWGVSAAELVAFKPNGELSASSPLLKGVVALVFLLAAVAAIAYGVGARTITSDADVLAGMGKAISGLGTYVALVFFAAQFVAYFKWTNLGLIFAVKGAEALATFRDLPVALMVAFIVVTAAMNLVMGSASAKWSIMAPIFVPMFMVLGISPEFTQVAYRIGDSTTNIVSPMMSYFALIVAFFERYDKRAGIGTVTATMLPYSVVFLVGWSILLVVWTALKWPLGPGAGLTYP